MSASDVELLARLPHAGVARMVDRIVDVDAETARASGRIDPHNGFVHRGRVPSFVLIEFAAQTAALCELRARDRAGPPGLGYLVRVREVVAELSDIPVDARLTATASRVGAAGGLSLYRIDVAADGEHALAGTIGTFVESA